MANDKGADICHVQGCESEAERSVSRKKVEGTSLRLKDSGARQVHLCKAHYRELKKETKGSIPDYMG